MLKIENLSKSFGKKEVLKNLNLEVGEGSIFGLVGVNGAGKSTLLRLISGVYKANEGFVSWNNKDTYCFDLVRQEIAFVSDDFYYPLGSTIKSLKEFYASLYNFDEELYMKYLELFELNENDFINNLSKGNKRRVSLLYALVRKPKLLLLDEAYDGLEPLVRLKFKRILADLIDNEKITVIISSHNLKELEDICDHFGILEDGRIVSYGDLLDSKEHVNKYQVAFDKEYDKNDFKQFDILHFEKEGKVYKLVIKGDEEETMAKLRDMNPLILDVLQINFEELFIYEMESRGHTYE